MAIQWVFSVTWNTKAGGDTVTYDNISMYIHVGHV